MAKYFWMGDYDGRDHALLVDPAFAGVDAIVGSLCGRSLHAQAVTSGMPCPACAVGVVRHALGEIRVRLFGPFNNLRMWIALGRA